MNKLLAVGIGALVGVLLILAVFLIVFYTQAQSGGISAPNERGAITVERAVPVMTIP